jgi:hypothetical protein
MCLMTGGMWSGGSDLQARAPFVSRAMHECICGEASKQHMTTPCDLSFGRYITSYLHAINLNCKCCGCLLPASKGRVVVRRPRIHSTGFHKVLPHCHVDYIGSVSQV